MSQAPSVSAPPPAQPDGPPALAGAPAGGGVGLLIFSFAVTVALIVSLWRLTLPQAPGGAARYFPLHKGLALGYRVSNADGTLSYQSTNVQPLPGASVIGLLSESSFRSLAAALKIDLVNFDVDAAQAAIGARRYARNVDIEVANGGLFTPTQSLMAAYAGGVDVLQVEQLGFEPPLPALPALDSAGAPLVRSGLISGTLPYTATVLIEAKEPAQTPAAAFADCLRVRSVFAVPGYASESLTWYCAGVGIVRQEVNDPLLGGTKRIELVSINTRTGAARLAPAEDVALPAPGLAGVSAVLGHVFAAPAGGTAADLSLQWSYTGEPATNGATTPILPAGDILLYGTQGGEVVALAAGGQGAYWRFQTGGVVHGAPVVQSGVVYAGASDGLLYALDLASGAFRWAFAARDAIAASPAVADGVVYAACEGRRLYAVDAGTGRLLWQAATGGPLAAAPVVAGDSVYAGGDDRKLYVFDRQTGQRRWTFATAGAVTAAPAIAGEVVYLADRKKTVYALKATTGRPGGEALWSARLPDDAISAPVPVGTLLYVASSSRLYALDARSGKRVWTYRSGSSLRGDPLVVGGHVLIRREHDVLALDAATGQEAGAAATGQAAAYAALSSDGRLIYVGHFDSLLQAFGLGRYDQ